jgi:hypothetical protein
VARRRRSTVILAVVGIVGVLCVAGIAGVAWFFLSVFESSGSDEASAARSFDEIRRRFAGVTPVLEMRDRKPVVVRQLPAAVPAGQLRDVQVLTWNPDDAKLSSIRLPFWLLRMDDDPIEVTVDGQGQRLEMTVAEIEGYGPTLLLDYTDEDGTRMLVWTE